MFLKLKRKIPSEVSYTALDTIPVFNLAVNNNNNVKFHIEMLNVWPILNS